MAREIEKDLGAARKTENIHRKRNKQTNKWGNKMMMERRMGSSNNLPRGELERRQAME